MTCFVQIDVIWRQTKRDKMHGIKVARQDPLLDHYSPGQKQTCMKMQLLEVLTTLRLEETTATFPELTTAIMFFHQFTIFSNPHQAGQWVCR